MATGNPVIRYSVDGGNRLVDVDDAFLAFAAENGLPGADRPAFVGRSLRDFVDGIETWMVYERLLERSRGGRTLNFPFRCDSPALRRFLTMSMRPLKDGAVLFTTTLLRTEPRAPVALLEPGAARSRAVVLMCAWCKRVMIGPDALEVEDAVAACSLFDEHPLPSLSHGMCRDCGRLVLGD